MQQTTDGDLIIQARSGDTQALGELFERYQPLAMHLAREMVKQEEVAQDLVQEAFLAAYLSLHQLRDDCRFKSWLYSIVLNVCRNYLRSQKSSPFSLEILLGGIHTDTPAFADVALDPQKIAEEHELRHQILSAIKKLSSKEQAVILLFYYDQLSIREIAAQLQISEVAVKSRLFQARKRLHRLLAGVQEADQQAHGQLPRQGKKKHMVMMNIEGVRRNCLRSDLYDVALVDETGQRLFTITIGQQEAYVIVMAQHQIASPRPLTLHFMAQTLTSTHVTLEEVRIERFQVAPLPFLYAVARLRNGDIVQELDVRPSDALGLAVLQKSPIMVSEELLAKVGIILSEGMTPEMHYAEQLLARKEITLPEGKQLRLGLSRTPARDAMVKEVKAAMLGVPQPPTEREFEQAMQNYLTFLLA